MSDVRARPRRRCRNMKTVPPAGVTNGRIKPRWLNGHPALHAYVMPSSLSRHRTLILLSTQGQRGRGSGLGVRWQAPTVCSGRRKRAAGASSSDGLPDQLGDVEDQIRPAVRGPHSPATFGDQRIGIIFRDEDALPIIGLVPAAGEYWPGSTYRGFWCCLVSAAEARWDRVAGRTIAGRDVWAPGSCHFRGICLLRQLTHLPVSKLPWPGAGGSG
jgi:hypothetical protein